MNLKGLITKPVLSWALYDWANSAFAVIVLTVFFPLFFKSYWSVGTEVTTSTLQLGVANSIASITIVLLAPILGAIADVSAAKKRFLVFFALVGIVMTGGLYFVGAGNWPAAMVCFVLAGIGFAGSNIFYDSLIVNVSNKDKLDMVSALGYSLGYLGGGLLCAIDVAIVMFPDYFGFASKNSAVQFTFLSVSLWWFLFSLPIILFVHEPPVSTRFSVAGSVSHGVRQLAHTFKTIRNMRVVFLFLAAYWLYIDGVDTIVRMAVDYGMALGFDTNNLIIAILITQFVGFPAALLFGVLGNKIGTKRALLIAIAVYLFVTVWGYYMNTVAEFYGLAITIGLVQGGVQSLSRSYYARIIPHDKSAEFFGFYNMLGKFAAVIGPLMMGMVGVLTGSPRTGILSIAILFILGGVMLYFVDEQKGIAMAKAMEDK